MFAGVNQLLRGNEDVSKTEKPIETRSLGTDPPPRSNLIHLMTMDALFDWFVVIKADVQKAFDELSTPYLRCTKNDQRQRHEDPCQSIKRWRILR